MTPPYVRLALDAWMRHRDRTNLRVHAASGVVSWLGVSVALSAIPLPLTPIPGLGANVGAWWTLLSVLLWLPLDAVVAMVVGAGTLAFAALPFVPWGQGPGALLAVMALPLVALVQRYAHVQTHEHAPFLGGDPPGHRLAHAALTLLFAPFLFPLFELLERGWRPALRARFLEAERQALRDRPGGPWQSWAGTARCTPTRMSVPHTRDDLLAVVGEARRAGRTVRVVGSGFSWSNLVSTQDLLVFCERLDRVEVDTNDPTRPAVWVEAGVTNRQLNRELARHGLALPWNVVLESVRVAGIVSAGTHGSGRNTGTMGDLLEAVEVIDSAGVIRTLSEATVGVETMRAVRLGLGLFGVILRLRLRVGPACRVRQVDAVHPVAEILPKIAELVARHDSVELYWFAFNRNLWLRTFDRTEEPARGGDHGLAFSALNLVQNTFMVLSAPMMQRLARRAVPTFQRFAFRQLTFGMRVLPLSEALHYRKWVEAVRCGCVEVGFPMDADGANVQAAFAATEELVLRYAERGLYPMNLTLNIRFVGSSDALLSPAFGPGVCCYIEALCVDRPEGWEAFSAELAAKWMALPGALPHWAKEFEHIPGVVAQTRAHLGERRRRFQAALRQVDPGAEAAFANPLLRRILLQDDGLQEKSEAVLSSAYGA